MSCCLAKVFTEVVLPVVEFYLILQIQADNIVIEIDQDLRQTLRKGIDIEFELLLHAFRNIFIF